MRNADFSLEEEETEDLLKEIEKQLKKRQWGQAIRLEVEKGIEKRLLDIIKKELMIDERNPPPAQKSGTDDAAGYPAHGFSQKCRPPPQSLAQAGAHTVCF